jgi:hypothetical protein
MKFRCQCFSRQTIRLDNAIAALLSVWACSNCRFYFSFLRCPGPVALVNWFKGTLGVTNDPLLLAGRSRFFFVKGNKKVFILIHSQALFFM